MKINNVTTSFQIKKSQRINSVQNGLYVTNTLGVISARLTVELDICIHSTLLNYHSSHRQFVFFLRLNDSKYNERSKNRSEIIRCIQPCWSEREKKKSLIFYAYESDQTWNYCECTNNHRPPTLKAIHRFMAETIISAWKSSFSSLKSFNGTLFLENSNRQGLKLKLSNWHFAWNKKDLIISFNPYQV